MQQFPGRCRGLSRAEVRWDGRTGSGKLTSHVYAQTGRFTVQVTATDSAGHVRTVKRVVTITAA